MLRIKKLDIFILKSFLLLFVGTFFICLFIFMMQFLWRYVDELVGKGLEMHVLAQFFYYSALSLVPASLPLAILLASLITFGNFGERYELLAMKAAGISLLQIMRPLIIFVVFLGCISFYFQNVIAPYAQLKLYTLLFSMKQKSPELDIPEGVFYYELDKRNVYVKRKDRKTGMLYDVTIYDFEKGFENSRIFRADSGKLEMTADKQHLYLHLFSGESFENLESQNRNSKNVSYRRETFTAKHTLIEFDSEFNMIDESFMGTQANSKDMKMLEASIDSMRHLTDSIGRGYYKEAKQGVFLTTQGLTKNDSTKIEEADINAFNVDSLFERANLTQRQKYITTAVSRAEGQQGDWNHKNFTIENNDKSIRRHQTEWHKKLTYSLSCIIFFFIGAPLGAIIRKGGLGTPVVVSVLMFIFYYVIDNMGYKMARDGKWAMFAGMWLSTAVLTPLGAFLTYKSNNDSVVLNADAYMAFFKRIIGIRSVRHLFMKDVIIHDPDYVRLPADLASLSEDCRAYMKNHLLNKAPNYLHLWLAKKEDEQILHIHAKMEGLIEEMGNTRVPLLLNALNSYPVIPIAAHTKPFHIHWLNILTGAIIPVGLFFYFRIWAFRIRLKKDLERIVATNEEVRDIIVDKIEKK